MLPNAQWPKKQVIMTQNSTKNGPWTSMLLWIATITTLTLVSVVSA